MMGDGCEIYFEKPRPQQSQSEFDDPAVRKRLRAR
jgi:hypothetical protein